MGSNSSSFKFLCALGNRDKKALEKYVNNKDYILPAFTTTLTKKDYEDVKWLAITYPHMIEKIFVWVISYFDDLDLVKFLVKHYPKLAVMDNNWPIKKVCDRRDIENLDFVRFFIENKADVSVDDQGLLRRAINRNNCDLVELLLNNGAELEKCNFSTDYIKFGFNLDMTKSLIEKGVVFRFSTLMGIKESAGNNDRDDIVLLIDQRIRDRQMKLSCSRPMSYTGPPSHVEISSSQNRLPPVNPNWLKSENPPENPVWKKNLENILKMEDSKADTDSTCVFCLENEPIIVFNCGHKKTCAKCTAIILQDTRKCPVCRALIITATKVYE